ncbi:MAG: BREX-2 system adenine-specific DNA-methyltransferase PglX [Polyangia bacterium]
MAERARSKKTASPRTTPTPQDGAPAPSRSADVPLTKALGQLLDKTLLPDLRRRAADPAVEAALRQRHADDKKARRTADRFEDFCEHLLEQVGAAWILSCVFIRTLEDRDLLRQRRLAGPGAADSAQLFRELFPYLGVRDYLRMVLRELGRLPGAADVLGPDKNPAWVLMPSEAAATALLDFFQALDPADPEGRRPLYSFTGTDTRFLGDLYQDLSASVRERYALLQTPHFVEQFILDQTLTPALERFGLESVRLLDPTCGSGHFLLGAFDRLFEQHQLKQPALDPKTHATAALSQIYGCDLNPYAVAIARFRLTLAYLQKAKLTKLSEAPKLQLNLVVADSLLYGAKGRTLTLTELGADAATRAAWGADLYNLEDPGAARDLFRQRYHAVVGNPPYITCKDSELREHYRTYYKSAAGKYALAAPFTECFFQLAEPEGYVGLINANSFMKREFGKKLIEEVLPKLDLQRIIDTSGAFIPGHGTPTVLLFGQNRAPRSATIPVVMGKRGEPSVPEDPEQGVVWRSIAEHFADPSFENDYISTREMDRGAFGRHPWNLGGGGAIDLKQKIELECHTMLEIQAEDIGFASFTGLDDLFILPHATLKTIGLEIELIRPVVTGETIRDWNMSITESAIVPYDKQSQEPIPLAKASRWYRSIWSYRTCAESVTSFGGKTRKDCGENWWEWYRWQQERYKAALRIAYAFIGTHNHFVLDRGGKVFNRSAPIIKLKSNANENDHLKLLGYLNSSVACFWLKQVAHCKTSASQQHHSDPARAAYEFSSTTLGKLPLPELNDPRLVAATRELLALGEQRSEWLSGQKLLVEIAGAASAAEIRELIERGWQRYDQLVARSAYLQEEIDWLIYAKVGLLAESEIRIDVDADFIAPPGSRPFEHQSGYDAGVSTKARRHEGRAQPIERPAHWQPRIALLERDGIRLLETREFKRQWRDTEQNVDQLEFRKGAVIRWLKEWVLDCVEKGVSGAAEITTTRAVASSLQLLPHAPALQATAELLGAELGELIVELADTDSVPYLAALRYSDSGMEKRQQWEQTWALQRRQDAGQDVGDIPVPPKYDTKDFRDPVFYRLRGKLDVPKERFIRYPGAERDDDKSPLLGWAGWDPLQRATALAALYHERKTVEGWDKERLIPLLAGVQELVPWLVQWHNDPSPEYGNERLGDYFAAFVEGEARGLGVSRADLAGWRPQAKARGRAAKAQGPSKTAPAAGEAGGDLAP